MRLDKWAVTAQEALQSAVGIATDASAGQVQPVHLLKALLGSGERNLSAIIERVGADPASIEAQVDQAIARQPRVSGDTGQMGAGADLVRVGDAAEKLASKMGDSYVTSEHLLCALADSKDEAGSILKAAGVTGKRVSQAYADLRGDEHVTSQDAKPQLKALEQYGRNVTDLARQGKLDPVIGRVEEIRRTIQKLDEDSIKQVNIEAKFIEVSDTVLHEVTANWRMAKNGVVRAGTNNRGSMETHAVDSGTKQITLSRQNSVYEDENGNLITMEDAEPLSFSVPVPTLSNSLYYGPTGIANPSDVADGVFGSSVPSFVGKVGTLDDYDVYLLLNLLDAKAGADIMAAPSLTVETDQPAEIEIAQLINFPSSYDDPQMDVSSSGGWNNDSNWGGSGGSVTIAPAVPQFDRTTSEEFEKVGIVLNVTPTVNADNSIKLTLDDLKIMEFEGFMDYGGTAVSMVGSTIVTMPMTYYQPVFNIRRVRTSVTIADGATMVIGGLMREEIKTVDDKVPILGDLPLIGAAFRGKSKAVQKKNLLVFITGNLMSRGGSTAISTFKGTSPAEIYSNPTFMSSAGVLYRESTRPAEENNAGANAASAAETPSSAGSL